MNLRVMYPKFVSNVKFTFRITFARNLFTLSNFKNLISIPLYSINLGREKVIARSEQ